MKITPLMMMGVKNTVCGSGVRWLRKFSDSGGEEMLTHDQRQHLHEKIVHCKWFRHVVYNLKYPGMILKISDYGPHSFLCNNIGVPMFHCCV